VAIWGNIVIIILGVRDSFLVGVWGGGCLLDYGFFFGVGRECWWFKSWIMDIFGRAFFGGMGECPYFGFFCYMDIFGGVSGG